MSKKQKVPLEIKHQGRVKTSAECYDCDWHDDDPTHSGVMASGHVRLTGHTVQVNQTMRYDIKPKKP